MTLAIRLFGFQFFLFAGFVYFPVRQSLSSFIKLCNTYKHGGIKMNMMACTLFFNSYQLLVKETGYLVSVQQPIKEKENSEFKPVVLYLKIDHVLQPIKEKENSEFKPVVLYLKIDHVLHPMSSLSSCHATSMDIPDSLLPLFPIIHRLW